MDLGRENYLLKTTYMGILSTSFYHSRKANCGSDCVFIVFRVPDYFDVEV